MGLFGPSWKDREINRLRDALTEAQGDQIRFGRWLVEIMRMCGWEHPPISGEAWAFIEVNLSNPVEITKRYIQQLENEAKVIEKLLADSEENYDQTISQLNSTIKDLKDERTNHLNEIDSLAERIEEPEEVLNLEAEDDPEVEKELDLIEEHPAVNRQVCNCPPDYCCPKCIGYKLRGGV